MKVVALFFVAVVACAYAAPAEDVSIVKSVDTVNEDGTRHFE
jgi:hypothetical protein